MKYLSIFVILLLGLMGTACNEKDDIQLSPEADVFVFGYHYGFCRGSDCSRVYKLSATDLSVTDNFEYDTLPSETLGFTLLSDELFQQTKDIRDAFPTEIISADQDVFGCPDCADQGTLLLEYHKEGKTYFWRIDTNKNSVPKFLHEFIDAMNEKFELLKN